LYLYANFHGVAALNAGIFAVEKVGLTFPTLDQFSWHYVEDGEEIYIQYGIIKDFLIGHRCE